MRATFAALSDVFAPMLEGSEGVFEAIRRDANYTRETVGNLLRFIDDIHNSYAAADNFGTRIENATKRVLNGAIDRAGGGKHFEETPLIRDWDMGGTFDRRFQQTRIQAARERLIRSIRTNGTDKGFTGKGMTDDQLKTAAQKAIADIRSGKTTPKGTGKPTTKAPVDEKAAAKAKRESEKAAREAERQIERDRRSLEAFRADKSRSEAAELDSRAALATTAEERFDFERQALEQDKAERLRQIDAEGPQGSKRYSEAQVAELKALEERIAANKSRAVDLKQAEFTAGEELKLNTASLSDAQDLVHLQSGLAHTSRDRRAADLRLLDLQMEQEKLALEAIVASRDSTEADKEIARRRLAMLPRLREQQGRAVEQQTMGPLASYLDAIPRTSDEINEALEGVEVQGLDSLKSGLLDTIKGVGDLGDAFTNMADTVIDGLLNIALQQMLIKPLGNLLFGSSGGGGGLFGSLIGGATKLIGGNTGKANGGMGNRGRFLVGEHGPEIVDMAVPFNVTPNHKLDDVRGSGGGINVTFGAITSNDPEAVKAMAYQAISEATPMLMKQSSDYTMSRAFFDQAASYPQFAK